MTWPAIVFWLLILFGALQRGPLLLYVFTVACSFGTLQMAPGDTVGGVNLLPQSVCAVFLVGKILLSQGQITPALNAALDPAKLGLLFLFLAYGLLSAYAMPRLFAHSVEVIPVSASTQWPVALEPTTANITQPAYLALSVGVALAFALAGERTGFQRHFLQALLVGGIAVIVTGLMDLILGTSGHADLLEPFRNASYSLLVDVEAGNSKRVVGLMPEASAYGPLCVSTAASLAFLRPFFPKTARDLIVPATIAGLVAMAVLSTSSTAYVGLPVFGMVYAFYALRRMLAPSPFARAGLGWETVAGVAALLAFLFVLTLAPRLLDPAVERFEGLVFRKTETDSYAERMMWNQVGMAAFFATNGVGVGLGSARSSNWYVAILSNTGIIGATLLGWFLVRVFLQRSPSEPREAEFIAALKFSLLPGFLMAGLVGFSPDFGVAAGASFGLIMGLASANRLPASRPGSAVLAGSTAPTSTVADSG
ncbi:MAG: hypothetical protein L0Y60_09360 [Beijerinckiaceae bacterium]|nr:hypothetical protein [Beijerinckiaceae bacterium]